jgi:hypothetical protein
MDHNGKVKWNEWIDCLPWWQIIAYLVALELIVLFIAEHTRAALTTFLTPAENSRRVSELQRMQASLQRNAAAKARASRHRWVFAANATRIKNSPEKEKKVSTPISTLIQRIPPMYVDFMRLLSTPHAYHHLN